MEGVPLKENRHLRFQKCLPTEYSQSASKVTNELGDVNIRFPRKYGVRPLNSSWRGGSWRILENDVFGFLGKRTEVTK